MQRISFILCIWISIRDPIHFQRVYFREYRSNSCGNIYYPSCLSLVSYFIERTTSCLRYGSVIQSIIWHAQYSGQAYHAKLTKWPLERYHIGGILCMFAFSSLSLCIVLPNTLNWLLIMLSTYWWYYCCGTSRKCPVTKTTRKPMTDRNYFTVYA
jgi:hypothetical protein